MVVEAPNTNTSKRWSRAKPIATAVFILVVALIPVISRSPYYLTIGNQIGIYAIASLGLALLLGYAGQVSMGQAAFFGIGAYASAILTTKVGMNPWLAMLAGMLFSAAVAAVTGAPLLRLEGHVLAVASLGLAIIFYSLFVQLRPLTGGFDGIVGIPTLSIAGFRFNSDLRIYYLVWLLVLLAFLFGANITRTQQGRALRSIHNFSGGNEKGAEVLGVRPQTLKVKVFVLSAVYASVAGSLWAYWIGFVNPEPFGLIINILLLIMVTIGGMGSLWGALIGPAVVVMAGEFFRSVVPKLFNSQGASGEVEIIAYGLLLIIILLVMPQGLASAPRVLYRRWDRRKGNHGKERTEPAASTLRAPEETEGM
jgi:branched-chain amino acid transport system permease protein